MKLVNLSVIDEDAQNEIQSIHSNLTSLFQYNVFRRLTFDSINNDENLYEDYLHHIIWAGHPNDSIIRTELERLQGPLSSRSVSLRSLVTILAREPTHKINRDYCIQLQNYGGFINETHVQNSIGDDLENLLQQITGHIFIRNRDIFVSSDWFQNEEVDSYHFYEISDNEWINLRRSDKRILHSLKRHPEFWESGTLGSVPLSGTLNIDQEVSTDEWKYVLSLCHRKTSLV